MLGIEITTTPRTPAFKTGSSPPPLGRLSPEPQGFVSVGVRSRAMIHIVDQDMNALAPLRGWLASAGLGLLVYSSPDEFLNASRGEGPGCLVIDIQQARTLGEGTCGLLQLLAQRHPVIVAGQADVPTAVRVMKAGAHDFVEKPYREAGMMGALQAAVALDTERRMAEVHEGRLRARFDTLSRRERQVMALATRGLLNKQIGGRLGVSEITVKAHRGAMMRKMDAATFAELVRMADRIGEPCRSCAPV